MASIPAPLRYSDRMNTNTLGPLCAVVTPADRATIPRARISRRALALGFDLTTATTKHTSSRTVNDKMPRVLHGQPMTSTYNCRCFSKHTRADRNTFALPARIFSEMTKSKSLRDATLRFCSSKGPRQNSKNTAFQTLLPRARHESGAKYPRTIPLAKGIENSPASPSHPPNNYQRTTIERRLNL